jgi:ABC-type Mn2+/Zn2+ transport system ATPase subunit
MITGLLLRHYKNYENQRFIPLMDCPDHMFSIYIGNNGVGKSAILEALNEAFCNHRQWNVTQGVKKTDSYICPVFLIPKAQITGKVKANVEAVSNFFWSDEPDKNANVSTTAALKSFIDYKNSLKPMFSKSHYFVMVGTQYDTQGAFFASFNKNILNLLGETEEEQLSRANELKDSIFGLYSYLYIPVEESPAELLQLQNSTMQRLLNKDILQEIEKILRQKQEGGSIVNQINKNLDSFIKDVNDIISGIDSDYSFAPESGNKKSLTAKDIRAKVIEAFFPLRTLKVNNRRVDLLSSGEQRRAIIDVAYSTLMANRDRKTEKNIVLAIDEPEISMHISNCFDQFSRLEELSKRGVQVIITTHWYGYLPIAQNGNMHYLELKDNQTKITSFNLYSLMEKRGAYPDDVDLKSMFDLASSLISYMRRVGGYKWIICEGSDDKLYLETMLKEYKDFHIIPLGGCGNVIKLYQILYGFMTEKAEDAKADILFLIDTDFQRVPVSEQAMANKSGNNILLRRLQIVKGVINLLNPASGGAYDQTEIEDCLNPEIYYEAVGRAIQNSNDRTLKNVWKKYERVQDAKRSRFRGDDSCIRATDAKYIDKKQKILDFVETTDNKYEIARLYAALCEGKRIDHPLAELIGTQLGLEKR